MPPNCINDQVVILVMPTISTRARLLKDVSELIHNMIYFDDDQTEDFEEICEVYCEMESCRFIEGRMNVPKSRAMIDLLLCYGDRDFRQEVRFSKQSFVKLV